MLWLCALTGTTSPLWAAIFSLGKGGTWYLGKNMKLTGVRDPPLTGCVALGKSLTVPGLSFLICKMTM